MRASCGCLVEDGMVLHGFDGPCADEPRTLGPTEADYCASGGHAYYGDEFKVEDVPPEHRDEVGRCYCGARRYPPGGPTNSAHTPRLSTD